MCFFSSEIVQKRDASNPNRIIMGRNATSCEPQAPNNLKSIPTPNTRIIIGTNVTPSNRIIIKTNVTCETQIPNTKRIFLR